MHDRYNQFQVTHTLTTYFLFSNFYTTTVTNDTLITDTLVLSTITFVVFYWSENLLTEQTVALRLEGTVVDRFRF
ncbi:hypothetical protein D3C87_1418480 [compost metagenome]